jgi:hypothetical protein
VQLAEGFSPSDVMLADALYCNYWLIATLMAKGWCFIRQAQPNRNRAITNHVHDRRVLLSR